MLSKLDKDLHGIELRLVPILTYKIDENVAARLNHVAIKHSQVSSNIKTNEIEGINNVDNPISSGLDLTLRKLIMDLKTENDERFFVTIIHNWNGALELRVKKKNKKFASVVANHLPAWIYKHHGDLVLPLLSTECQKIAKETKWEGNTPLNLDGIATQVIVDVRINWLIDRDNISTGMTGSNFIAVDDDHSIGSFVSSTSRVSFNTTSEVRDFAKYQCSNFSFKETSVTTDDATVKEKIHN